MVSLTTKMEQRLPGVYTLSGHSASHRLGSMIESGSPPRLHLELLLLQNTFEARNPLRLLPLRNLYTACKDRVPTVTTK